MNKKYMCKFLNLFLLISMISLMFSTVARAGSDTVNFDVKVTIVQKTCDINNNNPIYVEFGIIDIPRIDGVQYEQEVKYTLQCDTSTAGEQPLKFEFSGNSASFDNNLLQTSEPYLGIKLQQNGNNFAPNTWVSFRYSAPPKIMAIPVKSGSGGINDGDFSASATFSVEYE